MHPSSSAYQAGGINNLPIPVNLHPALLLQSALLTVCLRLLGWSAMAALVVSAIVYLLNWPLAKYDLYVSGLDS